jgi:hypothetical protein
MAPKSRSGWGRSRSFGRQAGDLHHRAGSRIGGDRDDDARRQARQHLCHPGKKHWITGGGVSKLHLIFARVFDERGEEQGIGGFLALGGTPGLIIGKREPAMGLRGIPETEIIFENLEIPRICWCCRRAGCGADLPTSSTPITASGSAPERRARTGAGRV